MQKKQKRKLIFVCLLLCALLLGSYATAFHSTGADALSEKSLGYIFAGEVNSPFSMNREVSDKQNDGMNATGASARIAASIIRQIRWFNAKTNLDVFVETTTVQFANLFYPTRLSSRMYSQFSSSIIISYLHKADGMK